MWVHDFCARPVNSPSLHEFKIIEDLSTLAKRDDLKLAVVCCPWPQYGALHLASQTQLMTPWRF